MLDLNEATTTVMAASLSILYWQVGGCEPCASPIHLAAGERDVSLSLYPLPDVITVVSHALPGTSHFCLDDGNLTMKTNVMSAKSNVRADGTLPAPPSPTFTHVAIFIFPSRMGQLSILSRVSPRRERTSRQARRRASAVIGLRRDA